MINEQRVPMVKGIMVAISMRLHLTFPFKYPTPDRPWMTAESREHTLEATPSIVKMPYSVSSLLKVLKTHFKPNMLEMVETELMASMDQLNDEGYIF